MYDFINLIKFCCVLLSSYYQFIDCGNGFLHVQCMGYIFLYDDKNYPNIQVKVFYFETIYSG